MHIYTLSFATCTLDVSSAPPQASYNVAILGAAGDIGSTCPLVKMSPLVSELNLYDIANVKVVAADLSHCNTSSKVSDFKGTSELADSLKGVNLVVIPAGVPRKPGMTCDDLFNINADTVKTLVEAASYKVAILGVAGDIGSTCPLVKMSPLVSELNLYDIANVKVVATDLSHCNTSSKFRLMDESDGKSLEEASVENELDGDEITEQTAPSHMTVPV
ncbi:unnamed protein product [Fraxinus pennsylvanica]|uniref:malate dehydrogenase n=1 Tax=Fraxinus pennsylvanica TaxID=56036 RepID=A0AAD1YM22_9LAMI|nr:unnamed protein product [Fraxinus pennsylvanica]